MRKSERTSYLIKTATRIPKAEAIASDLRRKDHDKKPRKCKLCGYIFGLQGSYHIFLTKRYLRANPTK